MIYQISTQSLIEQQMKKIGLTLSDTIDLKRDYSPMMRIELDSALLVLENVELQHDSIYRISHINSAFYLKK